ncbi:MAG: AAA family ATPase [Maritimibacter sp.]|nr:AAA family ATPase [Maritimibacter sp.]
MTFANPNSQPANDWRNTFIDAREHVPVLTWNYATKGWLRRSETSVLYGPSNSGKSALVCHLGHCIVREKPFFGARTKRGIVVHVGAEAPASILDRMQAYDIHDPDAAPYLVKTLAVDLSDQDAVEDFILELRAVIKDVGLPIALVSIDTLARSMGDSDENSSTAMTAIAQAAERIARAVNAHVMLVHHTGKDVERGGRGSSALRSAVDTEISLAPLKNGGVAVAQDKQRSMPKLAAFRFRTEAFVLGQDEDGEDRTTVRAVEVPMDPDEDQSLLSDRGHELDRKTAIITALHVRGLIPELRAKPFATRELIETLPEQVFERVADENRNRVVNGILSKMAQIESPMVTGGRGQWRLVVAKDANPGSGSKQQ